MVPAYIRIHDALKKKIDDGFWEIGQRLPSERDLADDYEVSRMTLRQAITLLVELLKRLQRKHCQTLI
jgi:GntR family transcriptional regulator